MECKPCGAGNSFVVEDAVTDLHIHPIEIQIEIVAVAFNLTRLQVRGRINL